MPKIKDKWLRFAIRESIGKVNINALKTLEKVDWDEYRAEALLPWGAIRSLEGLELCPQLKYLSLIGNSVGDISQLTHLENLETIFLSQSHFKEVSPLANKPKLKKLWLDDNYWLSDITPLVNLPSLEDLHLGGTSITDISPLANFSSLQYLKLRNTKITDLSPLANLTNLKEVDLNGIDLDCSEGTANFKTLLTLFRQEVKVAIKHAERYRKLALGISTEVDEASYAFYKEHGNEHFAQKWKEYQIEGNTQKYGASPKPIKTILSPLFLKKHPPTNLIAVLERLIAEGADINERSSFAEPPLFNYLRRSKEASLEVVQFLVIKGIYINTFYNGDSLYDIAVMKGHSKIADFLLKKGAVTKLLAQLQQTIPTLKQVQAHFPEVTDFRRGPVNEFGDFEIWGMVNNSPYPYMNYKCYFINEQMFQRQRSGSPTQSSFKAAWEAADKAALENLKKESTDNEPIIAPQEATATTDSASDSITSSSTSEQPQTKKEATKAVYDENPTDTTLIDLRKQFGKVVRYHKSSTNRLGEFKLYLEIWENQFFYHDCSYWGPHGQETKVHTTSQLTKVEFEEVFNQDN